MNMMTLPSLRTISVAFLRGKVKNGSLVGVARSNSVKPVNKRQYLQISSSTIPSIWSNHFVLVTRAWPWLVFRPKRMLGIRKLSDLTLYKTHHSSKFLPCHRHGRPRSVWEWEDARTLVGMAASLHSYREASKAFEDISVQNFSLPERLH